LYCFHALSIPLTVSSSKVSGLSLNAYFLWIARALRLKAASARAGASLSLSRRNRSLLTDFAARPTGNYWVSCRTTILDTSHSG
jgi:hypothetical protein